MRTPYRYSDRMVAHAHDFWLLQLSCSSNHRGSAPAKIHLESRRVFVRLKLLRYETMSRNAALSFAAANGSTGTTAVAPPAELHVESS